MSDKKPDKDWTLRIDHMLDFIERIERYVSGLDEQGFLSNQLIVDAVARNLETIGEASLHIPDDVKVPYPEIPWVEMRGLRIVLAHVYMGSDPTILWMTTQERIGPLKAELLKLKHQERLP